MKDVFAALCVGFSIIFGAIFAFAAFIWLMRASFTWWFEFLMSTGLSEGWAVFWWVFAPLGIFMSIVMSIAYYSYLREKR